MSPFRWALVFVVVGVLVAAVLGVCVWAFTEPPANVWQRIPDADPSGTTTLVPTGRGPIVTLHFKDRE